MSLYNILHGHSPNVAMVLRLLEIDPRTVDRFRDAMADGNNQRLVILTRTGGNNRECHEESIGRLQAHPLYIEDKDDDFDPTYALFYFRLPEGESIPEEVGEPLSLEEKTMAAVDQIKKRGDVDGGQ